MNNSDKETLSQKWLGKLIQLNPATGRGNCSGKAPHKPLLLLCLLDMAEDGEITQRTFTRTPDLVLRFKSYGGLSQDLRKTPAGIESDPQEALNETSRVARSRPKSDFQ